jgi:hypothetical protein
MGLPPWIFDSGEAWEVGRTMLGWCGTIEREFELGRSKTGSGEERRFTDGGGFCYAGRASSEE